MPKLNDPIVVVFSGGLDSTVLLRHALSTRHIKCVNAVSFRYGSKHNDRELEAASKIASDLNVAHRIMDLSAVFASFKSSLLQGGDAVPEGHYAADTMTQTVVPFRNGIMLACAAGYADSIGAKAVAIGSHAGDHFIYPDCRPAFTTNMAGAVRCGTTLSVDLSAPFEDMTKQEIVALGWRLDAPMRDTWSCYKGQQVHCGRCATCVERQEAFYNAGLTDYTAYEDNVFWREAVEAHKNNVAIFGRKR